MAEVPSQQEGGNTSSPLFYCLVGNIPDSFHCSDLRNYFSGFVENEYFSCFHFRHRPQVITINNTEVELGRNESRVKEARCSLVSFTKDTLRQSFLMKYNGKCWMDMEGNGLQGKCIIHQVKPSQETLTKFSKELCPPKFMPRGNVGTCTSYFLDLIKQCRLPPSLIKKLALQFPSGRMYKKYSKVPFDYGTHLSTNKDSLEEEELITRRGHTIPDVYVEGTKGHQSGGEGKTRVADNDPESSSDEDDDRCEDWERHEALHEDVTSQERLKERLYEEDIELVWEKGGPGIVWYTDAQYWQAEEGGFDEQTSDDWDVDMEGYYVPGGGDKDARDSLEMRKSERFQKGLEDVSVFAKPGSGQKKQRPGCRNRNMNDVQIGKFESFTKGIGRKVMENCGWREGQGLGKSQEGIKDALENEGKPPRDKRGIGYYGETLSFGTRKRSHLQKQRDRDDDSAEKIRIGTIYDNPVDLDREEPTLRSNDHTFMTRYKK